MDHRDRMKSGWNSKVILHVLNLWNYSFFVRWFITQRQQIDHNWNPIQIVFDVVNYLIYYTTTVLHRSLEREVSDLGTNIMLNIPESTDDGSVNHNGAWCIIIRLPGLMLAMTWSDSWRRKWKDVEITKTRKFQVVGLIFICLIGKIVIKDAIWFSFLMAKLQTPTSRVSRNLMIIYQSRKA